jgi:outer membrane protein OmpA-like peptidoglycan-associated protein
MLRFTFITLPFFLLSITSLAQSYKKLVKTGDNFYEEGYYQEAINSYLEAKKDEPNDLNLDLKIGLAYLKGSFKDRALPYLKKVHASGETNAGMKYHLGLAYQYNHRFEEALEFFKIYREEAENTFLVDQHIKQCNIGIEYFNNPKEVKASNLRTINSQYQDYAPLITADGNTLVFTSRRKGSTGGKLAYDNNYYEDIYVSKRENNEWTKPASISNRINTEFHECAAAISPDGTKLFIYSDEGEGDFYYSTFDGTHWSAPQAVSGVNSAARELSISVNAEGNKVYFSSNREGGYGGFDIYVSVRNRFGEYGKPLNLGPKINTSGDEDAPFIDPDGDILYFSSTGHLGMGGYDIFRSKLYNEKWTTPINLGYPINTAQDDNYFVIAGDNVYGYYATAREEGLGGNDIYAILMDKKDFQEAADAPPAMTLATPDANTTYFVGKVVDGLTNAPLEAEVMLSDNQKNIVITRVYSDPTTGEFKIPIPAGENFGLTVESEDYLFYSINFQRNQLNPNQEIRRQIALRKAEVGSIEVLKNIFFPINKSTIKAESLVELDRVYELLKVYPNLVIRINGHTDNVGDAAYNQQLSEQRAQAVARYLLNYGISPERVSAKGFGETQPIAPNNVEVGGRALNRRTEIEILRVDE